MITLILHNCTDDSLYCAPDRHFIVKERGLVDAGCVQVYSGTASVKRTLVFVIVNTQPHVYHEQLGTCSGTINGKAKCWRGDHDEVHCTHDRRSITVSAAVVATRVAQAATATVVVQYGLVWARKTSPAVEEDACPSQIVTVPVASPHLSCQVVPVGLPGRSVPRRRSTVVHTYAQPERLSRNRDSRAYHWSPAMKHGATAGPDSLLIPTSGVHPVRTIEP
ncbi:uncharacterized protein B0H18DRAFT_1073807 [Fomitopsis serialis]|uniref:uncharacterized protein n=1 Tax=Fomitopsis serialis TaxID=139415 RepID=UPI00200874EE|nr:uncharacterized protein B0H18DRAFT_1073807 [Neoantrodia serialis]KAH9909450.1 hypothetical protein B0H18DRAFT_1073807 [Neoantrodia serialis]